MDGDNSMENGSTAVVKDNHVNGMSNGYAEHKSHKSSSSSHHKSDHKDKHRDKDKDRHHSKDHKSSRDKDKDKDKHSSSRDKDKERHSSSHKSSNRDKEKDKEHRDKDKERSKDKDKKDEHRKSSSSSSRDKDKDKEHKSGSSAHKSSSSSKDKDKERDKQRDKDKEKERHKHNSSSSSSKDKHRDKDKQRDKERHHSSSSKDKDKERSKDKHRKSDEAEPVKNAIKEEIEVDSGREESVDEDEHKLVIKEEPESQPPERSFSGNNVSTTSSCEYNLSQFKDEQRDEPMEDQSEEDLPLSARLSTSIKRKIESDEDGDEDIPLSARKKIKKEKKIKKWEPSYSDEEDFKTKVKKETVTPKKNKKFKEEPPQSQSPIKKRKKKEAVEQEVWKWWEEDKKDDGTKWHFLEHKGPVFAPSYEPLPSHVKFYYDGKEIQLNQDAEEVAGFYAKMLDHDYTSKEVFNSNFFKDWRKAMTEKERHKITDLKKCDFKKMHKYFLEVAEKNRNRTKEEKLALKEKNEEMLKEYGFCTIDGHKEKIGNFKIEPPGLFRGRGEHPRMGMLKKRVLPEDIMINCSKNSAIPKAPSGHKWREVRHDSTVTWLASWTENVQNQVKYIMLNPSSKLKGQKDMQKYEIARNLHKCIEKIRREYKDDWKSKEMRIRQRAVALYFIDKLALRAGNEKDEDQADTVGCCSLRVEHIQLHEKKDDKEYLVVFDFLGKDSIRYYNEVPVEKRVFKNLQLFMDNKSPGDDLFDRLNTMIMNKHLSDLMEGLTAKVFRTYNASWTLQQQLDALTNEDDSESEKILSYNRANRAVAVLCNHQRAVPKGHEKSMEKLKEKIDAKRETISDAERQVKGAHRDAKNGSVKEKVIYDKKKKMFQRLRDQLAKLEIQETDRDENKTIALGTSKLNYLDPRISVAWCKKYNVPIEKIYNKTQRDKFRWAIDMAGPDYRF